MAVLIVLLSAVTLLLAVLYAQFRWTHRHVLSAAARLPCPPDLPLIGNAFLFLGGVTSLTKNIIFFTRKFKQLFCFWIGPVPVFVVSDPSDVQIILNSSNTLEKDDIYNFLKQFLGNGLLTAPVNVWKKYRRLLGPLLHPSNVEKFLPVFNDESKLLVKNLRQSGSPVDPRKHLFSAALDAAMRAVVGRNRLSDQTKEDILFIFGSAGTMFTFRLFKVWLHIEWVFQLLYRREMKEVYYRMNKCYEVFEAELHDEKSLQNAIPESYREYNADRRTCKNMIELCIDYLHEDKEDHKWRDEVFTMIVGATDTIVAALSFLFITLANDLTAQQKVYEEIQRVLGGSDRDLTLDDINAMTYLNGAILESMRIHGTFPVILRKATKDTKLSHGVLPAGSRVMLPLHAMGWDADQFPQPDRFIPERFSPDSLQEGGAKRHNYAFLPFSGGPRNCPGKVYAMHLMKIAAVHVLREFKVTSKVRMQDIEYELKVVMFSRFPLLLDFEPRATLVC